MKHLKKSKKDKATDISNTLKIVYFSEKDTHSIVIRSWIWTLR